MMCAASGAKDTASFEVRLGDGRLPSLSSITHEGIFYEHYFDVGTEEEALFSCDWSFAASKDPISGTMEYYVGCGMRGKLDGDGIKKHGRPPVLLSIVLDISGSMGSAFRSGEEKNKLEVAKDCVMALLDNLQPTDAFGLAAFDDRVEVVQEMQAVGTLDVAKLKAKIASLGPRGGTDMVVGFQGGFQLIADYIVRTNAGYAGTHSKRIMFLTDARPSSQENAGLLTSCSSYSTHRNVFTTFIGLGVDFGVELVDSIAHIKGCNYFTVMSSPEFKQLMEQDFDYVVTPCCFDLDVKITPSVTSAVQVERVYGSPGHEVPRNGLLLRMLSGFPSAKDESGGTKGGMILAKLAPSSYGPRALVSSLRSMLVGSEKQTLELVVTYSDVNGKKHEAKNTLEVEFGATEEHYSNNAIRKAILLVRFVNAMKWWIKDHQCQESPGATVSDSAGIPPAPVSEAKDDNSYFPLSVSAHYKDMLARVLTYYERTAEQLVDAGDADDRLHEHARQLVGLVRLVSAEDLRRILDAVTVDEVVTGGVDADVIQRRCEEALKADDLSDKREAFVNAVKRRLKEEIVSRLNQRTDKPQLKGVLSSNDDAAKAKKAELVEELAGFIKSRPDQDWSEWQKVAEGELNNLVRPPQRRFMVM